jgi:nucleotide-binding universal stress UspA family protein
MTRLNDLRHDASGPDGPTIRVGDSHGIATVVIGFDGSDTSWDALWWACGEARRLRGRALAVFVSSAVDAEIATAAAVGFDASEYAADADRASADQAGELWSEVQRRAAGQEVDLEFVHARGDPVDQLLHIAEAAGADAIAVGRSTKARHRLVGSLGRRLIAKRRAPIIVIVP